MREAGTAKDKADLCVDEIQVRQDGVYFRLKSGQMRFETTAFRTEALSLTALDPEEFISKVECVEGGLKLSFNTGRITTLEGQGELFGPFEAPMGFYIDGASEPRRTTRLLAGLRVKPLDDPGSAADARRRIASRALTWHRCPPPQNTIVPMPCYTLQSRSICARYERSWPKQL